LGARVDAKLMRDGLLWRAAKKAIVRLIVSTEAAAGQVEPHSSLRSELAQLRLSALQQRATTVGIEPAAIEGALNSDEPKQRLVDIIVMCEERSARSAGAIDVGAASPKQSMIELLLEAAAGVGGAASPALTGANAAQEAAAAKAALVAELAALRPTQLRKRAVAAGVSSEQIESAEDSDTPRESLTELIVSATAMQTSAHSAAATEALRAELAALRPTQLRKRCASAGIARDHIEEAEDSDTPKQSMIELLLEAAAGVGGAASPALTGANAAQEAAAAKAALVAELAALRPTQLRKRAVAAGVSSEQIESAEDSDTPRESLTELIVGALSDAAVTSPVPVVSKPAAATTTGRGHFGSRQKLHQPLRKMPPGFIPNGQHCMLSYQWDVQETVSRVRKALQAKGVKCWM
jgi:predicted hydrolase (HD superfamily)